MAHPCLRVDITALRDLDWYPGLAECKFTDAAGRIHKFVEKIPYVAAEDVYDTPRFPYPGLVRCTILNRLQDSGGRELVHITTEQPDYIESTEGISEFEVFASQLSVEAS